MKLIKFIRRNMVTNPGIPRVNYGTFTREKLNNYFMVLGRMQLKDPCGVEDCKQRNIHTVSSSQKSRQSCTTTGNVRARVH